MTAGQLTFDATGILGQDDYDRYAAVRTRQGSRTVYTLQLPLQDIPRVLPIPDPKYPTPGNRKVNPDHAQKFGEYIRNQREWVAPPLLVRDNDSVKFEEQIALPDGTNIGQLKVPRNSRHTLKIIDGQHRILGIDHAVRTLDEQLASAQDAIARGDNADPAAIESTISDLGDLRVRFLSEHLAVQIYVEARPQAYEQMFFDVADNALGITQAVKVRFDSRKVVNRSIPEVLKHALMKDRVDMEQDRVTGSNVNLLGAKHVGDIIRAANLGVVGRVTERREEQLDDARLIENTNVFLDCLISSFPVLVDLIEGRVSARDLRAQSLLGSITMLRVLAGAFHEIWSRDATSEDEVAEFFASLNRHMGAPIKKNGIWMTTGDFDENSSGPTARRQNLKNLSDTLVIWYDHGLPQVED
jgi:hypothetical protein